MVLIAKNQKYENYFETVEKFTQLKINNDDYVFDKVIVNEEMEYFTLPFEQENLNYREKLIYYLKTYLKNIIMFIRRNQKDTRDSKASTEAKISRKSREMKNRINNMNRKLTLILIEIDLDILKEVLRSLENYCDCKLIED